MPAASVAELRIEEQVSASVQGSLEVGACRGCLPACGARTVL